MAMTINKRTFPVVVAVIFLIAAVIAYLLGKLPMVFLAIYGGLSVVAFIVYFMDKSAAKSGKWRTPENTLHLLALAGGWPGALIAQQTLRHKTQKKPFIIVLWLTVLLNIGALVLLLTYFVTLLPEGLLRSFS